LISVILRRLLIYQPLIRNAINFGSHRGTCPIAKKRMNQRCFFREQRARCIFTSMVF